MHNHAYVAVLVTALAVLVLGCLNPKALQARKDGLHLGHPDTKLLALVAGTVGILTVCLCEAMGGSHHHSHSRSRSR